MLSPSDATESTTCMQRKPSIPLDVSLDGVRSAQREWARVPIAQRISMVRALRHRLASEAEIVAATVPTRLPGALHRTIADTLVAEVLPLIEACRFLERNAAKLLASRAPGGRGRPVWLGGVCTEIERVPWGVVLILAPANYPLLLAGVQALQALVAGNAVLWKPAPGTEAVAATMRSLLDQCGLPAALLTVLDADVETARAALGAGVDHVVLTGSAETGVAVLHQLAETLTSCTMELSGCDAVFVLRGAEIKRTVHALLFGLRFNGSFTCMAPRRVFLVGLPEPEAELFERKLLEGMRSLPPVPVSDPTQIKIAAVLADAREHRAVIALDGTASGDDSGKGSGDDSGDDSIRLAATLLLRSNPEMLAMRQDIFAPLLSVMRVATMDEALAANDACPFALTAAIFGPERDARVRARQLRVGHVLINDVIAPTADPRVAFGGRGRSGYGVTRGADGLLAMTTPRTVQLQRNPSTRAYQQTTNRHAALFTGLIAALHSGNLKLRWRGLLSMIHAAKSLENNPRKKTNTRDTLR